MGVIVAASLIFYAPWGARNLALLLGSVILNYGVGLALLSLPDAMARRRLALLILGEAANFIALIGFKYHLIGHGLPGSADIGLDAASLAIPVGISFYTFHQAAFLADAYGREANVVACLSQPGGRVRGMVTYGAFITFFPQLVIGPITYLKEFRPQTVKADFGRLRQTDLAVGAALIAIGLFKKLVLADSLAPIADPIFAKAALAAPVDPLSAWAAVVAYYLQLYFDFSGYSDMALGIARLFGIRFPINFFSPLKAVGVIDFYRRWHMTLTRVISRFLYTPLSLLGGRWAAQRSAPAPVWRLVSVWVPLLINFEVIGMWHGARLNFAVFGLAHGCWYAIESEVRRNRQWRGWRDRTPDWLRALLGRAIFLPLMVVSFALFRSVDLPAFGNLLAQLWPHHLDAPHVISVRRAAILIPLALVIVYAAPNSIEIMRRWRPGLMTYPHQRTAPAWLTWRPTWKWATVWLGAMAACLYFVARQPPFLYQGF